MIRPHCKTISKDDRPYKFHVCCGWFGKPRRVVLVNVNHKSQYKILEDFDAGLFMYLEDARSWVEVMARLDRWEDARVANV